MRLLFPILQSYAPSWLVKRELKNLAHVTASAMGGHFPPTEGLSYEECLSAYAHFTREKSAESLAHGDTEIRDRLFEAGLALGTRYRKRFAVSAVEEATDAMKFVYRMIGIDIDFAGDKFTVKSCRFSGSYNTQTCRIMSALDEGVFRGLSGSGNLRFSKRITEGCQTCRGTVFFERTSG